MSLGAELIAGETDFSGSVVILMFGLSIWLFFLGFLTSDVFTPLLH